MASHSNKTGSVTKAPASPAGQRSQDTFILAAAALHEQRPIRSHRLKQIASALRSGSPQSAEQDLATYLAERPDDADALYLLAQASIRLGQPREAAALLARAVERAPDFAAARYERAKLLFELNRFEAARDESERLLADDGTNPLFRQLRAAILQAIGEASQAVAIHEQLVAENPQRAKSWLGYGDALRMAGSRDKSVAAYRMAIARQASFGQAWWSLANMKNVAFSDDDMTAMQHELARTDISPDDRVLLQFSLGKALEDRGAFERSWEQYAKANAAMRLRADYDPETLTRGVSATRSIFTPEFIKSREGTGCKAPDPIFIVGRPRSGSTLIEQILCSHSLVEGTAELPYIPILAKDCSAGDEPAYPQCLPELSPDALLAMGKAYLEDARIHRKSGRTYFVDKNPANYFYAGFIHLILPNAKIIDARRNPAASGLSIFKQYYSRINLRLSELGRFYRDYVALMAHFDRVMPGRIHRVIYEDMVADPEAEIRSLLAFLGLPFEEACLRFYETDRSVLTPSSEQVRRPITGEAVDHWRNYEPWLGPLIKSLGPVLAEYPHVPDAF